MSSGRPRASWPRAGRSPGARPRRRMPHPQARGRFGGCGAATFWWARLPSFSAHAVIETIKQTFGGSG